MKVTISPHWRPRPLQSFLGFMDIKTGVTIALLFALLNKVAGIYGLIAAFTGGTFAQLSMYIYSVLALVALTWGLRAVGEEDPKRVLYFAHMFFLDHLFSTVWTVFFAVLWWFSPHDGKHVVNSEAQQKIILSAGPIASSNMTDEERAIAAQAIWNQEKGFAASVLVIGWLIKIYFTILIYSYSHHLRKGTYRSLNGATVLGRSYNPIPLNPAEDEGEEDSALQSFYTPRHAPHSSVASWTDFVGTPGRKKRVSQRDEEIVDEVLFDEDEAVGGTSSGAHSKLGTEETTSVGTNGEDREDGKGRWPVGGGSSRR